MGQVSPPMSFCSPKHLTNLLLQFRFFFSSSVKIFFGALGFVAFLASASSASPPHMYLLRKAGIFRGSGGLKVVKTKQRDFFNCRVEGGGTRQYAELYARANDRTGLRATGTRRQNAKVDRDWAPGSCPN